MNQFIMKDNKIWRVEPMESVHDDSETIGYDIDKSDVNEEEDT